MTPARRRHSRPRIQTHPTQTTVPESERIDASVLVVEDERMMSRVVGRGLSAAGCDVTFAANGEEALTRLQEALPDLVVSDVNMPRMDGFELLTRIRAQPSTRALPVILL